MPWLLSILSRGDGQIRKEGNLGPGGENGAAARTGISHILGSYELATMSKHTITHAVYPLTCHIWPGLITPTAARIRTIDCRRMCIRGN